MRKYYRYAGVILLLMVASLAVLAAVADKPEHPKFTFVVFGDNRPNRPTHAQPETFKKILKDIDALDPDFVVNTGDCIYGGGIDRVRLQYQDYVDTVHSLLRAKVYLTLGNHEIMGSRKNQEFFAKELGATYYSFDFGDSHFILLNSEVVGQVARITGEQLEWLKEDLQKARAARHKFVFVHRPLYPVGGHLGRSLDLYSKDRNALHYLFVRNRVKAVFSGHEHLFHEQMKNGVRYIITGGGGAFLYPANDGKGDFHHYVVVSIDGDRVEMNVVRPALGGKPAQIMPLGATK